MAFFVVVAEFDGILEVNFYLILFIIYFCKYGFYFKINVDF